MVNQEREKERRKLIERCRGEDVGVGAEKAGGREKGVTGGEDARRAAS